MKEYWCIYRITNNINGKTYIGQHKYRNEDNPMYRYAGSGVLLQRAYKKYGKENFSIEVLYKRIQYQETANSMEIWAIEKERKENVNGCYNITDGGWSFDYYRIPWNKGKKGCFSEETIKKLSKAGKGRKPWNKGKHISEETRQKIKGHTPWNKGKVGVSEETRKKMSESAKRRPPISEETRRKMSNSLEKNGFYGKHHTDSMKKKMSLLQKGKKFYNNGVINTMAHECPEGFVLGRLPRRCDKNDFHK